jgi:hypothetical protein
LLHASGTALVSDGYVVTFNNDRHFPYAL